MRPAPAAIATPTKQPFQRHPICLILAIAFAAIVGFFPPTVFSHGVTFIAYIIACAFMGLFIPLVLSFLAYWIFGRSSIAANAIFGVSITFVLGLCLITRFVSNAKFEEILRARGLTPSQAFDPSSFQSADGAPAPTTRSRHSNPNNPPQVRVYRKGDQSAAAPAKGD